jgi:hypothetical protein
MSVPVFSSEMANFTCMTGEWGGFAAQNTSCNVWHTAMCAFMAKVSNINALPYDTCNQSINSYKQGVC